MKKVYPILFFFPLVLFGQSSDSMKIANDELDSLIVLKIEEYNLQHTDFMMMRVYDTDLPIDSRCRFIERRDSCSFMHGMHISFDYTVGSVSVSYISVNNRSNLPGSCKDDIETIGKNLSMFTDHFKDNPIPVPDFKQHRYTVYGRIGNRFILETFEEDFVSSFHSGMLYDIVCSELGGWCTR